MKRIQTYLLVALVLGLALPGSVLATTVTLYYFGTGLMDQNQAYLPPGSMIQIISMSGASPAPINPMNGMPTGGDVLLGTTTISDAVGSFSSNISVDTGTVVYIRFFNADVMGEVTYYGVSGYWTVSDPFGLGIDFWDVTPTGSYFWTEYPFIVVPEPATWLMLLPGLLGGSWCLKRRKRRSQAEALL